MAYCRFSSGDVYMFDDVSGGITCQMCSLAPRVISVFTTGSKLGNIKPCDECGGKGCDKCMIPGTQNFVTKQEALDHLLAHRMAGDEVPEHAIEALRQDLADRTDVGRE